MERISIKTRTYFSIQHIQSAALFARKSADVERGYSGTYSGDLIAEHRAYVTAAISFAVAFLEALVNELFLDAHEGLPGPNREFDHLTPEVVKALGTCWGPELAWKSILDKFQEALSVAQKPPLPNGGGTAYENVKLLIGLRNALVHYQPETMTTYSQISDEAVTIHKFERKLRRRFALSPLVSSHNAFFPDRCLSHGCAQWAVNSSIEFADQFFAHLGIPPTFDHVRPQLKTE